MYNNYISIAVNASLMSLIVLVIPILIFGFFSIFKIKISKRVGTYLYSFTSGVLIVLGSFGLMHEAYNNLHEYFEKINDIESTTKLILISLIIGAGAVIGILVTFVSRFLMIKLTKEIHSDHKMHNHSDHIFNIKDIDNTKNKWLAIILISWHRVVGGLTLGILIADSVSNNQELFQYKNIGMIVTFIIHIIPENIMIYYRQMEMNIKKKHIALNTFLLQLAMIPFVFIGSFALSDTNSSSFWILPLLLSFTGVIFIITSIIELVPEFIHSKSMSKKQWYITISWLGFGIILALIISSIHSH